MKLIQFDREMFGLLEVNKDRPRVVYGNRVEMMSYLTEIVGISGRELLHAIELFDACNHNTALFGVNLTCIFTANEDVTEYVPIIKTRGVA